MDAAEAHDQLTQVTGARRPSFLASRPVEERLAELPVASTARHLLRGTNAIAGALGVAHDELEVLADAVRKLADVASEVVDADGREIWLSAGEIELDQWTQRLTDATAVVRRLLGSPT